MEIIQQLISKDKYGLKCPYNMNPKFITIHNTGNNASAQNEINYMKSNISNVSYHIAVDDKIAIMGIPLERNAWHAGDGSKGTGNRESIGIEICYSTDYKTDRHEKAFYNAIEVTKQLMKQFNIPIENIRQHYDWTKKDCPHRIRKEGTWQKFLSLCTNEVCVEMRNQLLQRIKVVKEGLYIRENYNGEIIGYIPEGSYQDFDIIMFDEYIQSDGYQHCKVKGTWSYKGIDYINQVGDIQFDSRCYLIGESE